MSEILITSEIPQIQAQDPEMQYAGNPRFLLPSIRRICRKFKQNVRKSNTREFRKLSPEHIIRKIAGPSGPTIGPNNQP